jgi:hypothetical protein
MNSTNSNNYKSGNRCYWVLQGCKSMVTTIWIPIWYHFWDPSDVLYGRGIEHFANVYRRIRGILPVWHNPVLDNINPSVACSDHQPASTSISTWETVDILHISVATFHFVNEKYILDISVFTGWCCNPTWVLTSLTTFMTIMKGLYPYYRNNFKKIVLWLSTTVFFIHSFIIHIATMFFTLNLMRSVIQKPVVKMLVSIQINLQISNVLRIHHR